MDKNTPYLFEAYQLLKVYWWKVYYDLDSTGNGITSYVFTGNKKETEALLNGSICWSKKKAIELLKK